MKGSRLVEPFKNWTNPMEESGYQMDQNSETWFQLKLTI
jgi:hypothetical protein